MKTETIQIIKNHLVSCFAGVAVGLLGMIPVAFGASRLVAFSIFVGAGVMFALDSELFKSWRFLSAFIGAFLGGIFGTGVMLWLNLPFPDWFRG